MASSRAANPPIASTTTAEHPDGDGRIDEASHLSEGGKQRRLVDSVVGMTPEKATATIKASRPTWQVSVTAPRSSGGGEVYAASCGANTVCRTEIEGDPESGGQVVLFVNRGMTISAPD